VASHIDRCRSCTDTLEALEGVGDSLRSAAAAGPVPSLAGLAPGVLARLRAESAHSWRSVFQRAVEDARWALVGGGSFLGTCASILLVWLAIAPGTLHETNDSMAARLRSMSSHSGVLMLLATPEHAPVQRPRVMMFDTGKRVASVPAFPWVPEDTAAVSRLMQIMTQKTMTPSEREEAEALVSEIRDAAPTPQHGYPPTGSLLVHQVHLVADVVTVRGL
jgi:hypothetical protein